MSVQLSMNHCVHGNYLPEDPCPRGCVSAPLQPKSEADRIRSLQNNSDAPDGVLRFVANMMQEIAAQLAELNEKLSRFTSTLE